MAIVEGHVPEQKVSSNGIPFPHLLVPTSEECVDTDQLVQAITTQKSWIEECLRQSGAILFRGFGVNSASDFERVVEALDYEPHEYSGGAWLVLSGPKISKVDLPVEVPLDYHNEGSFLTNPPSKMILFCEMAPPSGEGETTLLQGHAIYNELVKQEPKFVEQVREKKLVYSRSLTPDTWKSMFGTQDKEQVEKRVKKLDSYIEWGEDGGAFWYSNPREGVDSYDGKMVWFNSIAAMEQMDATNVAGSKTPKFGDGTELPKEAIRACRNIAKELEVAIPWCKGDVLLLDNKAVMHSRKCCTTKDRSILLTITA